MCTSSSVPFISAWAELRRLKPRPLKVPLLLENSKHFLFLQQTAFEATDFAAVKSPAHDEDPVSGRHFVNERTHETQQLRDEKSQREAEEFPLPIITLSRFLRRRSNNVCVLGIFFGGGNQF